MMNPLRSRIVLVGGIVLGLGFASVTLAQALPESVEDVSVPAEWMEGVVVNTPRSNLPLSERRGLRSEERDPYYRVLDHAAETEPERLRQAAVDYQNYRYDTAPAYQTERRVKFEAWVDLVNNADEYGGRPVLLSGRVRDWRRFAVPKTDGGIDTVYELWLYSDESRTYPTVILCSELPENFPSRTETITGVSVAGFFFKMYGYRAKDGKFRYAPLVIAPTVTWDPPERIAKPTFPPWMIGIIFGSIIAVIIAAWWSAHSFRRRSLIGDEFIPPPEFDDESPTVADPNQDSDGDRFDPVTLDDADPPFDSPLDSDPSSDRP